MRGVNGLSADDDWLGVSVSHPCARHRSAQPEDAQTGDQNHRAPCRPGAGQVDHRSSTAPARYGKTLMMAIIPLSS